MLCVTYGFTISEAHRRQDIVDFVDGFAHRSANAALPGRSLIDVFPILEKLPHSINPWKIEGERLHQSDDKVLISLLREARYMQVGV